MKLCRDPIWNSSVTWNTDNPALTQCLQNTLEATVSGSFVLFLLVWILKLLNKRKTGEILPTPRGGISGVLLPLSRVIVSTVILVLTVLPFFQQHQELVLVEVVALSCTVCACLLSAVCEPLASSRLVHTSPVTSSLWPLMLAVTSLQLKSSIIDWAQHGGSLASVCHTFRWIFFFAATVLEWMPNLAVLPADLPREQSASYISSLAFAWFGQLAWDGWRRPLVQADLPPINPRLDIDANVERFLKAEQKARRLSSRVSLWRLLIGCFYHHYLVGILLFTVRSCIVFLAPFLLHCLILFMKSEDEPAWRGYFYAAMMFASSCVAVFFDHQGLNQVCLAAMQMRNAAVSAIYRKSLRISSQARQKFTTGEITNFMSIDAQRIIESVPFSYFMIISPIELIICFVFLYKEVGVSVFAGIAVLVLITPFNTWGGKKAEDLLEKQLEAKDKRIKLLSEVLSGIKVLKMYAWEKPFMESIKEIRAREMSLLKYAAVIYSFITFTFTSVPGLMTLATFSTFILSSSENHLTAEVVFVSLSLFNIMRLPLTILPLSLTDTLKLFVSIRRIDNFLNADELDSVEQQEDAGADFSVELKDASFTWEDRDSPVLSDINLQVEKGQLVAVVGLVGAGKSSLLSAILGEMINLGGDVKAAKNIAYVAQQAWIQNLTVKQNILFGKDLDEEYYEKVISGCGLKPDLDILAAGDKTEIGENGINLSGGQKQRVAMARAVYQRAELYLFDDPLAALDAHVGRSVFKEVIGHDGMLDGKTRILVTHNVSVLKDVDVIVVVKDGQIAERGSYSQLLSSKGPFSEFLIQYVVNSNKEADENISLEISAAVGEEVLSKSLDERTMVTRPKYQRAFSESLDSTKLSPCLLNESDTGRSKKLLMKSISVVSQESTADHSRGESGEEQNARLTEDEEALTGNVKWSVYLKYFRTLGVAVFSVNFFMYFVTEALGTGANYSLSVWTDDPRARNSSSLRAAYMGLYGGLSVGQAATSLVKVIVLFLSCIKASRIIHQNLLSRVMHSPMAFFDSNPTGRILNRFSSDVDTVDQSIPFQIDDLLSCLAEEVSIMIVICWSTPMFMAVLPFLMVFYLAIQRFYIASSRQLKRLASISKSPIFSHFSETVSGAASIRAFKSTERFVSQSDKLLEVNNQCVYLSYISNRWLGVLMENLGNCVVLIAAVLAVSSKDHLSPGVAGLSVMYSLNVMGTLNWLVRMICSLETNCVSLERIFEYEERKEEAAWYTDRDKSVSDDWPSQGRMTLRSVTVRYGPTLPPVLKGLEAEINPGEKIGICGRTGAGKSSLALTLFRLMEADRGTITIDGVNIQHLGLQLLRSRLTVIPQDPVLFSSSVRFNLDPGSEFSDGEIERCLKLAGLEFLTEDLDQKVQEKGENFSVGQRQLICLARALLRHSQVLVLDEATASVDLETDDQVQSTIRKHFSRCTILTIAHRLNTIMDSDRVLVLDKGVVREFDTPKVLLENKDSMFYSLANSMGISGTSES